MNLFFFFDDIQIIIEHCDEMTKTIETLEKSIIESNQMMNDLINYQFNENKTEQNNDDDTYNNELKKVVKKKTIKEHSDDEEENKLKKIIKKKKL